MCAIVASKSLGLFLDLVELNQPRGTHSHSFSVFDRHHIAGPIRKLGPFDLTALRALSLFGDDRELLYVAHLQAPTGGLTSDISRVHPAAYQDFLLYHNGIIKAPECERLREVLGTEDQWDTMLLLRYLHHVGLKGLSDVDGSFACLRVSLFGEPIFDVFRSPAAPLFYDGEYSISSTKFEGSEPIPANIVMQFFPFRKTGELKLLPLLKFNAKSDPYFITDEAKDLFDYYEQTRIDRARNPEE